MDKKETELDMSGVWWVGWERLRTWAVKGMNTMGRTRKIIFI